MALVPQLRTRKLTIVAQDPGVRTNGRILTEEVDIPAEELAEGPHGYRVHVIDYDSSSRLLYKPLSYPRPTNGALVDPFTKPSNDVVLKDPQFHAQNVYAVVMRILARFEYALGRRVGWSFQGHQLKVAPHAFADANAFYSKRDEALLFGYFQGHRGTVFSCLSHDVVAHETTHALLDGLRERYIDPSSPDQAAFHEGFADVVALLSVFALRNVISAILDLDTSFSGDNGRGARGAKAAHGKLIALKYLTPAAMRESVLMRLAKEMGEEMSGVRGQPLRQSAKLAPSPDYLKKNEEFLEPHRRGEVLVAIMMNAFLHVWAERLEALGQVRPGYLDRGRVVEEGANAADYLLTMAIRALDYCMPVHMEFRDFVSALLTADHEIRPDDSKYNFRAHLRKSFRDYGVEPSAKGEASEPGLWHPPYGRLCTDRTHFESMQRDRDEVFRFIWENRKTLELYQGVYTRVLSVRPCLRIAPDDGFPLRETVAEYMQIAEFRAADLHKLGIKKPKDMPPETKVTLYGGGTLIFDEFGKLKFCVNNRLDHAKRQTGRLKHLWEYGYFNPGAAVRRQFFYIHRLRALNSRSYEKEEWS